MLASENMGDSEMIGVSLPLLGLVPHAAIAGASNAASAENWDGRSGVQELFEISYIMVSMRNVMVK